MPGENDLLNQIRSMLDQIELLKAQNARLKKEIDSKKPKLAPSKHLVYNPALLSTEQRQQLDYHKDQYHRLANEITRVNSYLTRLNNSRDKHQKKMIEIQQSAMEEVEL